MRIPIGMVRQALSTLVEELRPSDSVAIVAYDRNAWIVLDPTPAWNQDTILSAIDRLEPGGSTNAEAGLTLAYDLAESTFVEGHINRVVLASDGVANVGATDAGSILWRPSASVSATTTTSCSSSWPIEATGSTPTSIPRPRPSACSSRV